MGATLFSFLFLCRLLWWWFCSRSNSLRHEGLSDGKRIDMRRTGDRGGAEGRASTYTVETTVAIWLKRCSVLVVKPILLAERKKDKQHHGSFSEAEAKHAKRDVQVLVLAIISNPA